MSGAPRPPDAPRPVPTGAIDVPAPRLDWSATTSRARDLLGRLQLAIGQSVISVEEPVRQLLIGLLCEGHVLLEGVPGLAKTFLVRHFSERLDLSFRRIQFTPDMLPSDILGNMALDLKTQELRYRPGPIFANVVLADEINRAPPKVQSALLEAMQERQVTIDGVSHPLPHPFMVIATQNPVEQEGTYPLPEAELDRFMFRLLMTYPDEGREFQMLRGQDARGSTPSPTPILEAAELELISRSVEQVYVHDDVLRYLTQIVRATRSDPKVLLGASPRSAVLFLRAVRAGALTSGRPYAVPDDIKALAFPSLNHRLILRPDVLAQQISGDSSGVGDPTQRVMGDLIRSILQRIPAPH